MEGEYKVSNYYSEERVEKYRVKVIENPRISEENKSMILEFHEICRAQGLTRGRLAKTLWIMRTIGELMDQQSFRTATRSDLVSVINAVSSRVQSPATVQDYKSMLKKFYKHMLSDGDNVPDVVKWIKLGKLVFKKDPATILVEEDILKAIQAQGDQPHIWTRIRNRAMIAFLFDTGVRCGELRSMRGCDLRISDDLWYVTVRGKTGQRTFPIYTSIPYIRDYLEIHPQPLSPEAAFWCSFYDPATSISRGKIASTLKRAFKRAGLNKPSNPHHFRHSAVSRDSAFMSDQQLKQKYGWTAGSRQLETYSHIRLDALEHSMRKQYGLKAVRKPPSMLPKVCPYCTQKNNPHQQFCSFCRRPLQIKDVLAESRQVVPAPQWPVSVSPSPTISGGGQAYPSPDSPPKSPASPPINNRLVALQIPPQIYHQERASQEEDRVVTRGAAVSTDHPRRNDNDPRDLRRQLLTPRQCNCGSDLQKVEQVDSAPAKLPLAGQTLIVRRERN